MIQKKNCWEYLDSGRVPGSEHADELGVYPAVTGAKFDGINGGKNAGRFCWYVAGTLCSGKVQGTYATRFEDCPKRPFLREVLRQEGESFIFPALGDQFCRLGEAVTSFR